MREQVVAVHPHGRGTYGVSVRRTTCRTACGWTGAVVASVGVSGRGGRVRGGSEGVELRRPTTTWSGSPVDGWAQDTGVDFTREFTCSLLLGLLSGGVGGAQKLPLMRQQLADA